MQPTNPNQVRGSFSKPESLKKAVAEHEVATRSESPAEPKELPTSEEPKKQADSRYAEDLLESERQKGVDLFKDMCKQDLDLVIEDEDLRKYLFKGTLSKEMKINKLMKGTFQSLRTSDLQEIDKRMAKIRSESKFTSQGISNEEAVINLAFAWTHADGKPLGENPEDREKKIRQMGSSFVASASEARINFETLIKIALHSIDSVKK
jgi:hypothetical protein